MSLHSPWYTSFTSAWKSRKSMSRNCAASREVKSVFDSGNSAGRPERRTRQKTLQTSAAREWQKLPTLSQNPLLEARGEELD